MPQIVWREDGKFKIKYLTKEQRERIEQIKVTYNYKTLKEAYFHYRLNLSSYPEHIKIIKDKISEHAYMLPIPEKLLYKLNDLQNIVEKQSRQIERLVDIKKNLQKENEELKEKLNVIG